MTVITSKVMPIKSHVRSGAKYVRNLLIAAKIIALIRLCFEGAPTEPSVIDYGIQYHLNPRRCTLTLNHIGNLTRKYRIVGVPFVLINSERSMNDLSFFFSLSIGLQ